MSEYLTYEMKIYKKILIKTIKQLKHHKSKGNETMYNYPDACRYKFQNKRNKDLYLHVLFSTPGRRSTYDPR